MKQALHTDLMERFENPIEHACILKVGEVYISEDSRMPEGFCASAWESVFPFVKRLDDGESNFFDGWMKNPRSAMISCNDGFRPVSFYIEALDD